MAAYDLSYCDGVLAFGEVIRERYVRNGLGVARLDVARRGRRARARPLNLESPHEGGLTRVRPLIQGV